MQPMEHLRGKHVVVCTPTRLPLHTIRSIPVSAPFQVRLLLFFLQMNFLIHLRVRATRKKYYMLLCIGFASSLNGVSFHQHVK